MGKSKRGGKPYNHWEKTCVGARMYRGRKLAEMWERRGGTVEFVEELIKTGPALRLPAKVMLPRFKGSVKVDGPWWDINMLSIVSYCGREAYLCDQTVQAFGETLSQDVGGSSKLLVVPPQRVSK